MQRFCCAALFEFGWKWIFGIVSTTKFSTRSRLVWGVIYYIFINISFIYVFSPDITTKWKQPNWLDVILSFLTRIITCLYLISSPHLVSFPKAAALMEKEAGLSWCGQESLQPDQRNQISWLTLKYFHTGKFQWRNSCKNLLLIQRIVYTSLFLCPKNVTYAFVCSYRYHTVLVFRQCDGNLWILVPRNAH